MRHITERFLSALENQLAEITLNNDQDQYKSAVFVSRKAMTKLKAYINAYAFETLDDEIHFFKNIKPQFYSKYIYFVNLYNFTVQRPVGGADIQEAYIRLHLAEIKNFFDHNRAFYAYYRAGMTQLDQAYFTRGGFDVHAELEDFEEDELFSTSHDYKLSKIIANERFQDFLNVELAKTTTAPDTLVLPFKRMNWTANQTDAIELIYALKAYGAVNNGNIDIAQLVTAWEYIFQLDLKQAYHKFGDITKRKKNVPAFLNKLSDALLRWITDKISL